MCNLPLCGLWEWVQLFTINVMPHTWCMAVENFPRGILSFGSTWMSGSPSGSFYRSNTYKNEVLKEYSIRECSASEFKFIAIDKFSTNDPPLLDLMQRYRDLPDEKLNLGHFVIRELQHYKEARSYSKWEHEFLVAKMYYPNNSGVAGALLIDRARRPGSPDIVRVVPGDILHSSLTLLSRLGYHPSNLGRSCVFGSHPSVSEIASVLAMKSQAGREYTVHNHNCYWYAREVFDHCLDAYGGSITNGPYFDDLGTFVQQTPEAFVAEVQGRMGTAIARTTTTAAIVRTTATTAGIAYTTATTATTAIADTTGTTASGLIAGIAFTMSACLLAVSVTAVATYVVVQAKKTNKSSQVEPLWLQ